MRSYPGAVGGPAGCHLGSAFRLVKRLNELVAITRPVKRTGYKNELAYGYKPVMATETTNTAFQKKVVYVSARKKLEPYLPNAPRNRPKSSLTNVVGNRHRLHPCIE
ncbi:hypothetical protein WJX75_008308 [Coccomyxa subellipsoidea]|uniref:Uncharacterized protein n=1 Tax=Coccomyxa subellipsoidea TaxID=248742 RepID=A0ABR2YJU5_9CHLO